MRNGFSGRDEIGNDQVREGSGNTFFHEEYTDNEIAGFLLTIDSGKITSNQGFFSKPFPIDYRGKELIVKLYLPVKNLSVVSSIIDNHNKYIDEMRLIGIKIPETVILTRKFKNNHQLVIIQEQFSNDNLLKNRILVATPVELLNLCKLIFDDILKFWTTKKDSMEIGFHPTLRNYSLHKGSLFYFDTFPPMLMNQRELNRLIIMMSPFGGWLRKIVPCSLINRVSNEYYHLDKMFSGIVGSCCRLRPENAGKVLAFSKEYVSNSSLLTATEKEYILRLLLKPPRLSIIWILIRLLSGKPGKPNVKNALFRE